MAFTTSWIYKAVDKYSATGRKIIAINKKIKTATDKAAVSVKKFGSATADMAKKAGQRMQRLGDNFKKFGQKMTLFATLPIALMGRAMFRAASDAVETESKFNVVFEKISTGSNKMADSFAKDFDLAGSTARELLGTTGDILSGFGFTQEKALDLSLAVNELAGDLTSFKNGQGGIPQSSNAITKALLGEREMLKSLGIAILESDVKQKMLAQKAEGLTFASARQAKAFATLTLIQERGANAIGDYARTQDQAANVTRAFDERLKNLNEQFGKVFLPIATKVILKLTQLVNFFSELSPTTKKAILIVGGLVAVLGPLSLAIGGLIAIAPAMAAGFAIMFGPIGIAVTAAVALLALMSKIRAQSQKSEVGGRAGRAAKRRRGRVAASMPAAANDSDIAEVTPFKGRQSRRGARSARMDGNIDINLRAEAGVTAETDSGGFEGAKVSMNRGRNLAGRRRG